MNLLDKLSGLLMSIPYELLMGTAFACYCLATLVLLIQCFIPCVRRFYLRFATLGLERLGLRSPLLAPTAALLDTYTAWLHFAWGICLLPLCFGGYADTFHPSTGGPFNFGFTPIMLLLSCALMVLSFCIASLWALLYWLVLRRNLLSRTSSWNILTFSQTPFAVKRRHSACSFCWSPPANLRPKTCTISQLITVHLSKMKSATG